LFKGWFHITSSALAYQGVLLFCVVSSFLVLVPIAFIHEPRTAPQEATAEPKEPKLTLWKILFRPLTLKLAFPNLAIGFGAAILVPYFNVFFAERHQMSDASLGILFGAGSLLTGIACIIGPRLVGNLGGKVRTVILGQGVSLVFLLMIGFSPWPWLAVIGFLARGALMNMVAPLFDAFGLELSLESEHGAVNSIRSLALNVGWAVGPYISGLVQQRYGYSPLFISTAVLYSISILLVWIFFRPGRQVSPIG